MKNRYIYFVQEQKKSKRAPVKIGVAKDIDKRVAELQIGNPRDLDVVLRMGPFSEKVAYRLERDLHIRFSQKRIRGEWFSGVFCGN